MTTYRHDLESTSGGRICAARTIEAVAKLVQIQASSIPALGLWNQFESLCTSRSFEVLRILNTRNKLNKRMAQSDAISFRAFGTNFSLSLHV